MEISNILLSHARVEYEVDKNTLKSPDDVLHFKWKCLASLECCMEDLVDAMFKHRWNEVPVRAKSLQRFKDSTSSVPQLRRKRRWNEVPVEVKRPQRFKDSTSSVPQLRRKRRWNEQPSLGQKGHRPVGACFSVHEGVVWNPTM